jgi:hypothetical protein
VLQAFAGIHVLALDEVRGLVLNVGGHHCALLSLLGNRYKAIYSERG